MKKDPAIPARIPGNSASPAVTRGMVRSRAVELALLDGRAATDVTKDDWEQARLELVGDSEADAKQALLESAPESLRWDPVPGSPGHQAPEILSEDDDEEGRSETEQLVEQGVEAAEDDQALQAARDAEKKNRREP